MKKNYVKKNLSLSLLLILFLILVLSLSPKSASAEAVTASPPSRTYLPLIVKPGSSRLVIFESFMNPN
jgi:hypothetical protein